jgi:ATP-dependent Clp endopeptidase proteolytic subunit ClpP
MSDTPTREATDEERARWAALARKYAAEAEHAEYRAAITRLELDKANQEAIRASYADDYEDRTYRLLSSIDESSVHKCIKQLDAWHRSDPECKMTIVFDSPGGAVIPGFHLFDHILSLRETHEINTVTRGYAASMGGILLQAGEKRTMGRNAHLMIHEVSFGASGKIGDVEDGVEFAKLLWNRALDIFADRCKESAATKKLSRSQLVSRSKRKNWWIKATDALAYGLVDQVA